MRGRTRLILCLIGTCGVFGIAPAPAWGTPSAHDVSAGTPQDVPVEVTLRGGSNLDSPVTFSIVTGPVHGSLGSIGTPNCTFNPGVTDCTAPVSYSPDPGYSGPDSFTYRVGDADGTADATASIMVVPPPPPGFTATAFAGVDPGTTGSLALPGIQGTLTNPGSAPTTAYFVLATYLPSGTSTSYDVRTISVSSGTQLTVTFSYIGDDTPSLLFLDKPTGSLVQVPSNTYVVDPVAHTITIVFNATSFPTITDLTGTRFVLRPGAPRIGGLRIHPHCVQAGARRSPSLRLSLSEAARVVVSVSRRRGSADRASCERHKPGSRHAPARFERPRRLSRDLSAGRSRIRLAGLAPGTYRVKVIATNANGSSSATRRLVVVA